MNIDRKLTGTYVIIAICTAVFVLSKICGLTNANSSEVAIVLGAYYKPFILAGEWWRLLTVGFVHMQILHMFVNMMSLYALGRIIEPRIGHFRFLLVLFVSVAGGSIWTFILNDNVVSVGLSGGLYGLLAYYIIMIINDGGWNDPLMRSSIMRTVLINLCINFMPGISYSAHIGGAITGILFSMLLIDAGIFQQYRIHTCICIIIYICGLGYMSIQKAYIPRDEMYKGTDYHILEQYQQLGLSDYADKIAENLDKIYGDNDMSNIMKGASNGQKIY